VWQSAQDGLVPFTLMKYFLPSVGFPAVADM